MGLRTGAIRAPESGTIDRSSQIATLHTASLSQQPVQNPLGLTSVPRVTSKPVHNEAQLLQKCHARNRSSGPGVGS
jgi:hypothetical protein